MRILAQRWPRTQDHRPVKCVKRLRLSTAAAPAERFRVEPAYFCSQLVCAAWRAAGQLPLHVQPASFWPGDCGARGAVEGWLVDGCSLGEERRLDWEDGATLDVGLLERNERE